LNPKIILRIGKIVSRTQGHDIRKFKTVEEIRISKKLYLGRFVNNSKKRNKCALFETEYVMKLRNKS
jgi:hypothetical protein